MGRGEGLSWTKRPDRAVIVSPLVGATLKAQHTDRVRRTAKTPGGSAGG
jgi:hypothetical protein